MDLEAFPLAHSLGAKGLGRTFSSIRFANTVQAVANQEV